jgi:hypothetical protein
MSWRPNEWQRLWMFVSVAYLVVLMTTFWSVSLSRAYLVLVALLWLIPSVALYALGWSIAWVGRHRAARRLSRRNER